MHIVKLIKFTTIAFLFLAFLGFLPLQGAINAQSVTGTWTNAKSGGGTPSNFSGGGTDIIHWGFPAEGGSNSGYKFAGNAPQLNLPLNTPFALGTFTHFNFPITGNALTSVDLTVNAAFVIDGSPQNFIGTYSFTHNETPNVPTPGDPNCCNDIVTFQNNVAQLGTVSIGGINYTIGLLGFQTSPGGSLYTQFSTVENQQNVATLFAEISRPEVFAPEPSTYLIMGSFLAVGAFFAHRRKSRDNEIVLR